MQQLLLFRGHARSYEQLTTGTYWGCLVQGTKSPQEAADRLLSSVYMAIVSDVGEAEGLSQQQASPRWPLSRGRLRACYLDAPMP
jgi:hypothetical protein